MAIPVSPVRVSGFEWKVKNPLSTENLESDDFVLGECRWRFHLNRSATYINISLSRLNPEELNAGYTILSFVENRNQKPIKFNVLDDADFVVEQIWCISREDIENHSDIYLADGTLTFGIVFTQKTILEKDGIGAKGKVSQTSINMDTVTCLESLSLDLRRLLGDGAQTDVTLKCGERSFPAHKGIMSARSEVFAAMFRSGMSESHTGVVQISDMDASVLDQFLHYIYSGNIPDLSIDNAPALYMAGDKYRMENLKSVCFKFIQGNLRREDACKILVFADANGYKDLKNYVMLFIMNVELLRDEDIWIRFLEEHPKLANEVIYRAYAAKCDSNTHVASSAQLCA